VSRVRAEDAPASIVHELLEANERFAASFDAGSLPRQPARRVALITCIDARMDPMRFAGLEPGDANVLRNAGGVVTDDVLRSLAISHHLLGTREAVVVGHTDCGMATFTNEELHARLGREAEGIDFLPFDDVAVSVRDGVARIREFALLPDDYGVRGFVYDVRDGRLREVV